MNSKIQQLISSFEKPEIDAYLVSKDVNIRYLTDFPASESWLLVSRKKVFYITDFRYILEAKSALTGMTVKRYQTSWMDTLFELTAQLKIKRLGFDDRYLSLATYKVLQQKCPKQIKLVSVNSLVENLRMIKSELEVNQIRKALRIHKEALKMIKGAVKPGIRESDLMDQLEAFVKAGQVSFSFPPIIASGPNGCFPHARISDRIIQSNEPVLIDTGIDYNGYKSDLTRMVFLGKIPRFVSEVYEHVRQAQYLAIQSIKAGVCASKVDFQARNYLTKQKLGKFFGHSLGHGVGLEIHEDPRLSSRSDVILKEGMVCTVEPAVYIPHQFGIRIEDMVLITKQGCEVLSGSIDQ